MDPELLRHPVKMFHTYQEGVNDELYMLAQRHAAHDPNLSAIEPQHAPDIQLFPPRLKGHPKPPEYVDVIAGLATQGRFPAILDQLTDSSQPELLDNLGKALDKHQNIMIVTNHGEIADVAVALAAFYSHLKRRDHKFSTGIVISRMVSFLGYKLGDQAVPATSVLKDVCNDIYLSFPRTETMGKAEIPSQLIDTYNKLLRGLMNGNLRWGRHVMALAASGTTDKPGADEPNTIAMGRLTAGTIKLLQKNALVVPVAIWLKDREPVFEIACPPLEITNENYAHSIMEDIADCLNDKVSGKTFYYRSP